MRMKKNMYWLAYVLVFLSTISCGQNKEQEITTNTVPPAGTAAKGSESPDGKQLFQINCAQCHQKNQDFTGPALRGVSDRWKDKSLLYSFIRNSQEVIAKDAYAKQLFVTWKQTYMQPFPNLKDADIDALLAYCNEP